MNKLSNNYNVLIIVILIIIDIVLIAYSGANKGLVAFISIPLILFINFTVSVYGFVKKDKKLGVTALILFFIAPVFAFIIFAKSFVFLTR